MWTLLESMDTGIGNRNVTGLAAVGTVIKAVNTEPDPIHSQADATIFLASAVVFRLVALHAHDLSGRHGRLQERLYLTTERRGKHSEDQSRESFNGPHGNRP
jgi:hypothetical protein